MLDYFSKTFSALEKLRPGLVRQVKERAVLSFALGGYRTPSNHHLRRALRISWIKAASTIVDHQASWAHRNPNKLGTHTTLSFAESFSTLRNDVIATACNNDSGDDIGSSPIDEFLDALFQDIGQHMMDGSGGTGRNQVRSNFAPTLARLTGSDETAIPSGIVDAATNGLSIDGAERRDFGQLVFDEFSRMLQDPSAYPEVGPSFQLALAEIHRRAQEAAEQSGREQLAQWAASLTQDVRAEVEKAITESLEAQLANVTAGLDEIRAGQVLDSGMDRNLRTVELHTPVRDRTVMLAGLRARPGVGQILDEASDEVSRSLSRGDEVSSIVPLTWDVGESLRREELDGDYARTAAWTTLNELVVGGVLILDATLGKDIEPDDRFVARANDQRWLAPHGPVDDMLVMRAVERIQALEARKVPITYETRFALECVLNGMPLLVIIAGSRDSLDQPVRNLLDLLSDLGVPTHRFGEDLATSAALGTFVSSIREDGLPTLPNPYRGLDYYQISDAQDYHGRAPEAARTLAYIREAFEDERALVLSVTGPSGCGKSSFMRARIAAGAIEDFGVEVLEFRPTDFRAAGRSRVQTLPVVCEAVARCLELSPPNGLVGEDPLHHTAHARLFKRWLDQVIGAPDQPRMLVCIDQFEEILDDITEDVHAGEWRALFDVLTHLVEEHHTPLIVTVEDSRLQRFERLAPELGLQFAKRIELPDRDPDFYRDVIQKPFAEVGIDLADDIVEGLLEEVSKIRDDGDTQSSVLPLLALRLEALFRELAPRRPKTRVGSEAKRDFDHVFVQRDDLNDRSLVLGDMIAELAETAWRTGGGGDKDIDLGYFLRPFLRLSLDRENPAEAKLVLQSVTGRGWITERRLESEFRRRRVLVPSGGGLRLVHESIVRRWPRARRWFEAEREQLIRESTFRARALRWNDEGAPELDPAVDEISLAAHLLQANVRDWSLEGAPPLDPEANALRRYALTVFEMSTSPLTRYGVHDREGDYFGLAAKYGLDDLLKRFLEFEPSAIQDSRSANGDTALAAAGWSHPSTVRLLLAHGADPNDVNSDGWGALHSAVQGGQSEVFDLLLPLVRSEAWGERHVNPLCSAASSGRLDMAEALVSHGFSHVQESREGWTPLHAAATQNDVDVFRHFLERGDPEARWRRVKSSARGSAKTGDPEYNLSRTPLHIAAANGHLALVRVFLNREGTYAILDTPTETGETPLISAARSRRSDVVELLLAVASDPNVRTTTAWGPGYTALHHALADFDAQRVAAPVHLTDTTSRTVLALLSSPEVNTIAKTTNGKTAWQMAIGLPDLQKAIEAHPTFSDEARKEAERQRWARPLGQRQQELIDAVLNDKVETFEALLDGFGPGENIEGHRQINSRRRWLGELMLQAGMTDLLVRLIEEERLRPWRMEIGYQGLLLEAHRQDAEPVIDVLRRLMPRSVPHPILQALIHNLDAKEPDIVDSDGALRSALLDGAEPADLSTLLFSMGRRGKESMYRELVSRGADEEHEDDWGRTAPLVSSAALRAKLSPTVIDAPAMGSDAWAFWSDGWTEVQDADLLEKLSWGSGVVWGDNVALQSRALPFYPGSRLLIARDPTWTHPLRHLYWLQKEEALYRLNGVSPPIHEFNAKHGLELTEENALEYLRFFCFFVRGEQGPFYVVPSTESRYLPASLRTKGSEATEAFKRVFQEPRSWGMSDEGHYRFSGLISYSDALFVGDFSVHPTGMVEMVDDEPLAAELPDKVDAPI